MSRRSDNRKHDYFESQLVSKLDATPEPNHFNAHQARLEHDLITTQDLIENLYELAFKHHDIEPANKIMLEKLCQEQKETVMEYLKRMRMIAGISIEMPDRKERRRILRATNK